MDVGHLAPEIIMVIGAVTAVLTAAFVGRARQGLPTMIAGVAVVASAAASVGLAARSGQQLSFERAWALDGVTHAAEVLVATVTLLVLALSSPWFATDARRGEYPAIVLLCSTGAMVLAGAADTMEIVVGMLLVSVTGYTLAAYHRASPAAVEAGMKYFLIGALTNAVLMVGVVVLYGMAGTTNLAATRTALAGHADAAALVAVVIGLSVGLAFEIGAVPAHVWVPDVAQASPAPSAALLTVVPKVGALIALVRVLHVLPDSAVAWRPVVAGLAAVTMTLGNLAALWQSDVRRLLGWSSVSQAGYALVAVVVIDRTDQAVPALLFFLAGYAVANTAAFAVITQLRGRSDIEQYRGLAGGRPWLAAALTIALLSLVGIPPLCGFVGKLTVFTAAIDGGYAWLAIVAVANTVISLFYYLRVVAAMYFDAAAGAGPAPVLGRFAAGSVAMATAAVIGLGLAAEPFLHALRGARLLP
ncbi:NADH-quinone oxidoreductase subunit NuoN [soil metagenome]